MKIVINSCYGGFGLSAAALDKYAELKGAAKKHETYHDRADPTLIEVVQIMGSKANGRCAKLKVIEIPDGIEWEIKEYDGNEWVAEKHRTWS